MKKLLILLGFVALNAAAQEFNVIPKAWKWVGDTEAVFSHDGTFTDSTAFAVDAVTGKKICGIKAPDKYADFPVKPERAVNMTYSPDSTKIAYTRDNDLYVMEIATGREIRLTSDGSDLILNGYASWVYYEEILGRPSRYRAFWWSPDSRKIGFYRFDNTGVPLFPIYSAFADPERAASQSQSPKVTDLASGGSLSETRYPKAGQRNPEVRIGIVELLECDPVLGTCPLYPYRTVWADFNEKEDQYFGMPFWSPDGNEFFISRMPRLQNSIELFAVDASEGTKRKVYEESCPTWLDWISSVVFTDKGLYMVRNFETGWQQIYFLSYDGRQLRRLTDGQNWSVSVLRADESKGEVYFLAKRDGAVRHTLYKVDAKGRITPLTDPSYHVQNVVFSPDGKHFVARYSNVTTPSRVGIFPVEGRNVRKDRVVADMAGPDFNPKNHALGEIIYITTEDGFRLPGMIVYPKNFDPGMKYPVHVDIYGGPDTPLVRDRWVTPDEDNQWWSENGIIQITVDPRAAGHNGRAGLDMIYRQLTVWEIRDFCAWADYLRSLPYVDPERIGVEGFSFGGTMTSMLVMRCSDRFPYGIAGGGVYDWALYDSHYTERYMDTPQNNPEGYGVSKVLNYVEEYPAVYGREADGAPGATEPVMLKLTHGTGDDNVHHQNTLQLVDRMQECGKKFEFMIYPDGMHGYHGYQGRHFKMANRDFWRRYLCRCD